MNRFYMGPLAAYFLVVQPILGADDSLDEIVVTAGLRSSSVAESPQSVTVLDGETLRAAGVQHSRMCWVWFRI